MGTTRQKVLKYLCCLAGVSNFSASQNNQYKVVIAVKAFLGRADNVLDRWTEASRLA